MTDARLDKDMARIKTESNSYIFPCTLDAGEEGLLVKIHCHSSRGPGFSS